MSAFERYQTSKGTLALLGLVLVFLLLPGVPREAAALAASGMLARASGAVLARGIDLSHPAALFGASAALSNLVSNVPAVMLLLPLAHGPAAGAVLALASTLAGNLLIVGSIANIIVVDAAQRQGVRISWRQHARIGVPVTLLTLAIAALWLWVRA